MKTRVPAKATIRTPEELGSLIARAHYQAWRLDTPPFDLTVEELAAILPNLIKSGSAGIVWHRIKPVRERYGALAMALEAATEAQIAHNKRVEKAVVEVVTRLRAHGIEPVLVKGLAVAKLYPEGIIRPAGDIDLVVRKHEFAAAHAIIHDTTFERIPIDVDLKHPDIWNECPRGDFWARTKSLELDDTIVQVPSDPDSLQLLSVHFLVHFAVRPLWACDICLLSEAYDLDDPRALPVRLMPIEHQWLSVFLAYATNHLGVGCSTQQGPPQTPLWFAQTIEARWARYLGLTPTVTSDLWRQGLASTLLSRWPDKLEASIQRRREFRSDWTFPTQLMAYLGKMSRFGWLRVQGRRNVPRPWFARPDQTTSKHSPSDT